MLKNLAAARFVAAFGLTQLAFACALLSEGRNFAGERRLFAPSNTRYPAPSKDPFYTSPSSSALRSFSEGDIIHERDVTDDLAPGIDYSMLESAHQLLYKTQTSLGAPDVTATLVFKPRKQVSPVRVLSLAAFVDTPVYDCANSWAFIKDSGSNSSLTALLQVPFVNAALNAGYAVTVPDFQASQAAYVAGYGSGRAQLDGTRAILRHNKTVADPTGHKIIFTGYSGGAHAAAWAAQLSREYSPDLNVVGASLGGLPADLLSALLNLDGNINSYVALSALVGVANAYEEFNTWLLGNFGAEGRKIFDEIRVEGGCLLQSSLKYAFQPYFSWATSGAASVEEEVPKRIIELNRLGSRVQKDIIRFPLFVYHSATDELIPEAGVNTYVTEQCAGGANVEYSLSYVSEHLAEYIIGFPRSWQWIVRHFADDTPKQVGCSRTSHGLTDVFSPFFQTSAGSKAATQVRNNINFKL